MADPLLVLAANPESAHGTLRLGGNLTEKQSLEGESHPFARLLAGHAGATDEVLGDLGMELPVLLAGKPHGQSLATGGKELPDAARLLALAGLAFTEPAEGLESSGGEPGWSGLPAGMVVEEAGEGLPEPAAGDGLVLPGGPDAAPVPVPGAGLPGAGARAPSPAGSAADLAGETAGSTRPMPMSGAGNPPAAPAAVSVDEVEALPLPEPVRAVTATAVHQVLQARSAEAGTKESRFGELIRAAATRNPEPGPRLETTPGFGVQAAAASQAQVQAPSLPATAVAVPLGQAGWDQALGEQVQWMVGNRLQGAEIRLNPAHLGPMEVRIQMQNDQANISFTAQHGVAREALEAAIPRLREMLGESGLQLNQVTVSDQSLAEQRRQDAPPFAATPAVHGGEGGTEEEPAMVTITPLREGAGTIDYFA